MKRIEFPLHGFCLLAAIGVGVALFVVVWVVLTMQIYGIPYLRLFGY